MKRCPECRRDYYDDTLMYCLEDGTALVQGAVPLPDEPQTAILHETSPPSEAATRAQMHTTEQTAVLPRGAEAKPRGSLGGQPERHSLTAHRATKPLIAVVAAVVLLFGGYFAYRYFSASEQIESIAVMPFVNESRNADLEYLSDGMTETLIKSLSQIPDLNVRPRASVFRYKGKDTDLQTIGKELSVQAVLNGRVAQRGEQLTLSLELVDVENNRVIWTEQYKRSQADIVSLQSEIAKDISAKLVPQISEREETKIAKQATADPAAYQAYLRGRYYWNKRTGEDIGKAIDQFQIAIDRDPNYAMAFVGLADAYSIYTDYSSKAPADSMSRAEGFARQALAIDEQLAEPHATVGNVYYNDLKWSDAETEYKRAIELNPNYATAYHWYSVLLFAMGRNDEGAKMILRAQELDPLSNIINQNVAQWYRMEKDYNKAIEICQKVIDFDPDFPGGHFAIAWSYLSTGRNNDAIAEFQKAADLNGRQSDSLGDLGLAFAASGRKEEAEGLVKELEERYKNKRANGVDIATIYVGLGDKDRAFEWLEKDVAARNPRLAEFRWSERSIPLRDDPRFRELLKRIGLPE
ncbi:MAG: tetratricopeptide repeat protein [Pyrinomonadaceae bacterium]